MGVALKTGGKAESELAVDCNKGKIRRSSYENIDFFFFTFMDNFKIKNVFMLLFGLILSQY